MLCGQLLLVALKLISLDLVGTAIGIVLVQYWLTGLVRVGRLCVVEVLLLLQIGRLGVLCLLLLVGRFVLLVLLAVEAGRSVSVWLVA